MKFKHLLAAALLFCTAGAWAQTDVTSTYIQNAGFDDCTAETSDVAAKTIKDYSSNGWTNAAKGSYTTIAVTAYGGGKKVGNSTTPSTKKDGTTVSGNTLGIIAGWGDDVKIQSSDITLPAGFYTLTIDHYLTSSTNNYSTSRFGFVTASNSYIVASTTFTASTWTTETVTFTLTESTTGKIQIGLLGNNKTGSGAPAVFYDDVKLTYTDPEAAAHAAALEAAKYTLNGYIKKATALNGVLADATLTTAIETAQGVYDTADDYAEDYANTVSASTTLNTAITTALSGATTVSLTNANFDTDVNIAADGTNSGTMNSTATSAKPYIWDITGWTANFTFSNTASQGNSAVYGAACSGTNGTNGTNSPATDMFGATDGGTLHVSSGWSDQARYKQEVASLPAGRYVFYYEANNQNSSATTINSNYFGVSGSAGDFYGTTNSYVYSDAKKFAYNTWTANAFEFEVAKEANITFHVGVIGTTGGSGNGAKLWIDNVLVYRIGDVIVTDADAETIIAQVEALDEAIYNASDKTALATAKTNFVNSKTLDNYNALNSALVTAQNSINTYKTINSALTLVEGWTSDATTVTAPMRAKYTNGTYSDETSAANIYAEYQAAEIAAIVDAGGTDFTTAILNPSFETGDMTGWSAESRNDTGVKRNDNATYSITSGAAVDGDYLFNSWGGTAENNVYQTIPSLPAGTYQLSALLASFNGEEVVLAANEETNSVTISGDKTTGYTVNVIFTLAAAADVVIKASNTKGADGSDASFIKADNFTLKAYSDPLAALKEQLDALQTQAETLLANDDYSNVTGAEKNFLSEYSILVPDETEEAYNTAISKITAAISDFTAAKGPYDALVAEIAYAKSIGVTDADNYAAEPGSTVSDVVSRTQDLKIAEFTAVHYEVSNDVSYLLGPWDGGSYGTTSGQGYVDEDSYFDKWSATATDLTSSVTSTLPAGKYAVQVAGRGVSSTTMILSVKVGDAEAVSIPFVMNGDTGRGIDTDGNPNFDELANYSNNNNGRGWQYRYIPFTTTGEAVTITISGHLNANTWQSFYAPVLLCDDATKSNIYAGEAEYTALSSAIETAEAKTLGFADGEYAPYANVAALKALADAKAINKAAQNRKDAVVAATTALANATWTANDGDVDAIYNGMFATVAEGQNYPDGWKRTNGWGQMKSELEGNFATAYYNQPGSLQYGNQGVYTMPLAANTAYQLTFSYRSHENNSNQGVTVSVLNGESEGLKAVTFERNGSTSEWASVRAYFTTGAAGNYVLTLANNGNTWMTDVSLTTFPFAEMQLADDEDYAFNFDKTYMEKVAVTRKVVAGYNTVCMPFDLTAEQVKDAFGENAKVYTFEDVANGSNSTINFNTKEGNTIAANVPVLVGDATASTAEVTFNGVIFKSYVGDSPVVSGTNFDFVGTYDASTDIAAGDYFIGNGALYKSTGATTIKAFRAYIKAKTPGAGVKMFVDGIETGIDEINGADVENGAIYNLAGQRVNKAQKGVFIVNGKKVIVK